MEITLQDDEQRPNGCFRIGDKMKCFFSHDYPQREICFDAVLRISYFNANFTLAVLITYLTDVWHLDFFQAMVITSIRQGVESMALIFIASLADAFLGNSLTLLLSAAIYIVGLMLLFFAYPHVTEEQIKYCTTSGQYCTDVPIGFLFYAAMVFITVGKCGYINYEKREEEEKGRKDEENERRRRWKRIEWRRKKRERRRKERERRRGHRIERRRKRRERMRRRKIVEEEDEKRKQEEEKIRKEEDEEEDETRRKEEEDEEEEKRKEEEAFGNQAEIDRQVAMTLDIDEKELGTCKCYSRLKIQITTLLRQIWVGEFRFHGLIGIIIAVSLLSRIPKSNPISFLILACALGLGCAIFIMGKILFYPYDGCEVNPLSHFFCVYVVALKKWRYDIGGTCKYLGDDVTVGEQGDQAELENHEDGNSGDIDSCSDNADENDNDEDDSNFASWNNPIYNGTDQNSEPQVDYRSRTISTDRNLSFNSQQDNGTDDDGYRDNNQPLELQNGDSTSTRDDGNNQNINQQKDGRFNGACQNFESPNTATADNVEFNHNFELPDTDSGVIDNVDDNHNLELHIDIGERDQGGQDPQNVEDFEQNNQNSDNNDLTEKFRCLNKAALYKPSCENPENEVKKWRLCTVKQVEDAKRFVRAMRLGLTFLMYGMMTVVSGTFFVEQLNKMNRRVHSFTLPVQVFMGTSTMSNQLVVNLIKWILSKQVSPSQRRFYGAIRIGLGMFLSIPCFVVAYLVEHERLKQGTATTVDITAFWLVPQLVLMGAMNGLAVDGMEGFFKNEVPNSLRKTYVDFLIQAVIGTGKLLSVGLFCFLHKVSKKYDPPGWFGDKINEGHLDYFYVFMAVFGFLSCIIYAIVAFIDARSQPRVPHPQSSPPC